MRLLIVDDSTTARTIVKKMFKDIEVDISEAGNGKEALDLLNKNGSYDLALVDWNMPVMNGIDFLRTLRSNHDFDNMLVVMITTEVEISRITDALTAGANEYIMKPFTKDILIDKLNMIGLLKV